ncbi:MAG: hypothetical protein ACTSRU_17000 [Candidatus Hodarchaeales archaeon]
MIKPAPDILDLQIMHELYSSKNPMTDHEVFKAIKAKAKKLPKIYASGYDEQSGIIAFHSYHKIRKRFIRMKSMNLMELSSGSNGNAKYSINDEKLALPNGHVVILATKDKITHPWVVFCGHHTTCPHPKCIINCKLDEDLRHYVENAGK